MQKLIAFLCLMGVAPGLSAQCAQVTVTFTTDSWVSVPEKPATRAATRTNKPRP